MKRAKLSGLDALRMAREQREQVVLGPVVSPLRRQIDTLSHERQRLEADLAATSSIVTSEIAPHVINNIRAMVLERVEHEIYCAMWRATGRSPDEVITVAVLANQARFLRPDEVTDQILNSVSATYRKEGMRAVGSLDREASVTFLRVTIPKVEVNVALANESLGRRRRRA